MGNVNEIKNMLNSLDISEVDKKVYFSIINSIWKLFGSAYKNVDKGHNENHIFHVMSRGIKMVLWLKNNSRNFNHDKETKYILKVILASIVHDVYSYTRRKNHHEEAYLLIRKLVDLMVLENNNSLNVKDKAIDVANLKLNIVYSIPNQDNVDIIEKFNWLKYFTKYDLLEVSNMVNEHRASYDDNFSSELCELFSAADRDDLDLNVVINRIHVCSIDDKCIFNYDLNNTPLTIKINNIDYHSAIVISMLKNKLEWDESKIRTFYHLWEKFSRVGYMYNNLKIDGFYMRYYKDTIKTFWSNIDDIIIEPTLLLKFIKES